MDVSGGQSPPARPWRTRWLQWFPLCLPKCDAFDDGRRVLRSRIDSRETSFWEVRQTRVNCGTAIRWMDQPL